MAIYELRQRHRCTDSTRKPHLDYWLHVEGSDFHVVSRALIKDIVGCTVESTTGPAVDRIRDQQKLTFLVRSSRMQLEKPQTRPFHLPCGFRSASLPRQARTAYASHRHYSPWLTTPTVKGFDCLLASFSRSR